jgi:hypothetical protein
MLFSVQPFEWEAEYSRGTTKVFKGSAFNCRLLVMRFTSYKANECEVSCMYFHDNSCDGNSCIVGDGKMPFA